MSTDQRDCYDFHNNIFKQYCDDTYTLRFSEKTDYDKGLFDLLNLLTAAPKPTRESFNSNPF